MLRFRSNYPLTTLIVLWAAVIFAARPPMLAPQFSLTDIAGQTVNLGEFRGQNVLLVFGTTHCPHCEDTIPVIDDFCVAAQGEIAVFFVAIRQDVAQVADFFADQTPSFGILLDETGFVARSYKIKRVPACVFVDDQGLVQYVGRVDENILWRLLSGERPVYPDSPPPDIKASDRFKHRPDHDDAQTKHFIVELNEQPKFHKKLSIAAIQSRRKTFEKAAEAFGGRVIRNYGMLDNKIVIEIDRRDVDSLKEIPRFKSFKEARRVYALLEDSAYQIYADYAWDNAITGQGVKVCVVDTGIDYTHPDLLNKVVAQYNVTNGTTDAMDDHGHGTHCAGIIASEGLVYRGVSHDVALMGVKVLDYSGAGYDYDVAAGINWCVEQGADVISLSLGEGLYSGTCDENLMAQAVNHAVDPCGVVVACASGNDGNPNGMVAPACASKAIAVGAVDKLDNIASYSDGGPELDLVAPGGDMLGGQNYPEIVSTFSTEVANNPFYCMYLIAEQCYDNYFIVDGTRYIRAAGTSMATPHVAAAAALLLEANPYLTPAEVKAVLEENADDLGAPGWDNVFGSGRINVEKALDNIPPALGELNVTITEPNANDTFAVGQDFNLAASVDCFGGDGCGEVLVYAQYCEGLDCNDFADINSTTPLSTLDNNPNELGILSGYTVDTDVPVIFDAQTTLDISEQVYTKSINPESSLIGSTLPSEY
ncbi:MAG: S8 family serine peptidase, partial [Planctomycetota bacterium]